MAAPWRDGVRIVRSDSFRGITFLLTVIVAVQVSCRELKRHRSPAVIRRPWSKLRMVAIQDYVVSHLASIHILTNLLHDDPWDIPRLLAMRVSTSL